MKYLSLKVKKESIITFLLFIFCFMLTFVPLDKLSATGSFFDRDQYFNAYLYKNYRLDSFNAEAIIDYFTYEWGWHYLNAFSYNILNLPVEFFFGCITFLCLFVYGIFVLKKANSIFAIFYLINPVFFAFAFSQMRLAFAMVVLLLGIYFFNKSRYILFTLFLIISLLIHTAISIFFIIFLFSKFVEKIKNNFLKIFSVLFFGLFLTILTGPLREVLLTAVGDRRAEYKDMSSPTIYFLFYVVYLFYIFYQMISLKKRYMDNYIYNYAFIIFSFTFMSLIFGGYVSRFIAASHCFIVISLFLVKDKTSIIIHFGYILYLFMLWYNFLT